jgi:hypothetical protein
MSAVTDKFKSEPFPLRNFARFLSAIRQTKVLLKGNCQRIWSVNFQFVVVVVPVSVVVVVVTKYEGRDVEVEMVH